MCLRQQQLWRSRHPEQHRQPGDSVRSQADLLTTASITHIPAGLDNRQAPPFCLYCSLEARLMHLQASPKSFRFSRFLALLAPFCILHIFPGAWAQEQPASKPAVPRKQTQRQPSPFGNAAAVKDPVEEHYRAAETFQLAGDLNAAESEYRRVISLALQRLAALRVLAQDQQQALVFLQSAST